MRVRAVSAVLNEAPSLRWLVGDAYHIVSECGRFTVQRRNVSPTGLDWYIACRRDDRSEQEKRERYVMATELGATSVSSTRATDAERKAAIKAMQQVCEAAALAEVVH